jgi:hypothetical protein
MLILGWYNFLNSFMPLYKSLIVLLLLLVSRSLIFPYIYSLSLFLNILLVSHLKFFRLTPLIWLGFCNHCNLACFRLSINFEHSLSSHDLLCFILRYLRLSLAEVLMFSLILSQALLMSKLLSKLSTAANLTYLSSDCKYVYASAYSEGSLVPHISTLYEGVSKIFLTES